MGLVVCILIDAGCHAEKDRSPARDATHAGSLVFRSQELPFGYERGETGAAWPVETTGGGVGLLDYDSDGRLDLFFAQGGPLLPNTAKNSPTSTDAMLKNLPTVYAPASFLSCSLLVTSLRLNASCPSLVSRLLGSAVTTRCENVFPDEPAR